MRLGVILLALMLGCLQAADVSFEGRRLLVDGEPFQMRGVCYQPVPLGEAVWTHPHYGDYYTENHAPIYERDLPRMREMGANTIRLYSWVGERSHTDFLDRCWNSGVQPLYLLINVFVDPNQDWADPAVVTAVTDRYLRIHQEVGNHPAFLGFIITNEAHVQAGNEDKPAFWEAMNTIAGRLCAAAPNKVVTLSTIDNVPLVARVDAQMTNINCWAMQVYRGDNLWEFLDRYEEASTKPLLMTEFGYDAWHGNHGEAWPDNAATPAAGMRDVWLQIAERPDLITGACIFEWTDEWWKAPGSEWEHGLGGSRHAGFADGWINEEFFGIHAIVDNGDEPDILLPRELFYVFKGLWGQPETLAHWSQRHFSAEQLSQPSVSGPLADPDGDGLSNLFEYKLGLDPKRREVGFLSTRVSESAGADYLELEVIVQDTATDVTLFAERSYDLLNWSSDASAVIVSSTANADGTSTVLYRCARALEAGPSYMRLRAVGP